MSRRPIPQGPYGPGTKWTLHDILLVLFAVSLPIVFFLIVGPPK